MYSGATGLIFAFLFPLVVPEPPRTTACVESTPEFRAHNSGSGRPSPSSGHIVAGTMVGR